MMQEPGQKRTRAIVAAVQRSSVSDAEFDASLTELRQLAKTLGFEVVATFTQNRAGFDKTAYFGTGKREELKLLREEHSAGAILIDHEISPSQMFNLEKEVGGEVMDRTMVILEIFHRHARSPETRRWSQTSSSPRWTPRCARSSPRLSHPCSSATRWASSRTCRTAWSRRSSRRSTKPSRPRCWPTSSMPAIPGSNGSSR